MLIRDLTRDQCLDVLRRRNLCRLACAHDNQPYVVPIHYSFDAARNCLYGFSSVGRKIAWMRENPQVCLQVDDIGDKDHWTSVVVFGRYEELQNVDSEAEARQRALELFQDRPEWWFPGAATFASQEPHAVVVYRIVLDRITGRSASRATPI
jgi:nitroimidazol reductase NimA-like FMN-containing flavoprotein (pyridoxamine 5'-phosphate oxidase superfamily)